MRKLFFFTLLILSTQVFAQQNTLYSGEIVKPKMGNTAAFETKWKSHVAKYHGADNRRLVFEILSGNNTGCYMLIQGPTSFADMDKENPTSKEHNTDFETGVVPSLEKISGNNIYRWVDTLSYNGSVPAEKFINTVYHIKDGKQGDFITEVKRAIAVNKKINSPSSYNFYIKQFAGSQPEFVIITNLKDGFKQLDNTFNPSGSKNFREAYIKEYSQDMWDKRMKLLSEITNGYETYISQLRTDLSSPVK